MRSAFRKPGSSIYSVESIVGTAILVFLLGCIFATFLHSGHYFYYLFLTIPTLFLASSVYFQDNVSVSDTSSFESGFLDHIARAIPDLLYVFDFDQERIIYLNPHGARIFGYEGWELKQPETLFLTNIFHPDDYANRDKWYCRLAQLKDGEVLEHEFRIRHKNGSMRWLRSRDSVFKRSPDGRVLQTLAVAQDITEKKAIQDELDEVKRRNASILKAFPDMMFVFDRDGSYLDFYAHDKADLDSHPGVSVGRNVAEILPRDVAELFLASFKRAKESSEPASAEYTLDITGSKTFYEFRVVPMGDSFLAIVRNITDAKKAEQTRLQSEAFAQDLIVSSSDCMKVLSADGTLLYMNPVGYELINSSPPAYIGSKWVNLWSEEDRPRIQAELDKALNGQIGRFQGSFRTPLGELKWWDIQATQLTNTAGESQRVLVISRDITEPKLAGEKMLQKEQFFRSLVENTHDIISVLRLDGSIVYESPSSEAILGYAPGERDGLNCFDFIHPNDISLTKQVFGEAVASGGPSRRFEYRYRHKDGRYISLELVGRVSTDENGESIVIVNKRDITERKDMETKLKNSEGLYRTIVETQKELICRYLPDSTMTFVNEAYCNFFEKSSEDLVGRKFLEIVPEHTRRDEEKTIERLVKGEGPIFLEHEVIRPDGKIAWVQWTDFAITDSEGNVVEMQGTGRDVTEQRISERALAETQEKYRQIVETMLEGIWIVGTDFNISFVNRQATDMLGYGPGELLGTSVSNLYVESSIGDINSIRRRRMDGVREQYDAKLRRKDGSLLWTLISATPINGPNGEFLGSIAMINDITERRRIEDELRDGEERMRIASESANIYSWEIDPVSGEIKSDPNMEKVLGFRHASNTSDIINIIHPYDRDAFIAYYEKILAGDSHEYPPQDYRGFNTETGELIWMRVKGSLVPQTNEKPARIVGLTQNVTAVKNQEDQIRELAARLLTLQDEERRHLARELHDETAQNLAALEITLSTVKKLLTPEQTKAMSLLEQGELLNQRSLREVRTMSYVLHPPSLDDRGLVSAISWLIDGFSNRSGISVDFEPGHDIGRLPGEVETALYRIVQEGLNNIHRHSKSDVAWIALARERDGVILTIRDEGIGLPASEIESSRDGVHLLGVGIPGMRERLRLLGGKLDIISNNRGTTLTGYVPLQPI